MKERGRLSLSVSLKVSQEWDKGSHGSRDKIWGGADGEKTSGVVLL